MKKTGKIILGFCLGLAMVINITAGNESSTKTNKRASKTFDISAKAWGPTQADVNAAKNRVENSLAVRNSLSGKKHRLLEFKVVERTAEDKTSLEPTHFRAYYYVYTNDKTIVAEGDFAGAEPISVRESDQRMDVSASNDELEAGFELIKAHPKLGRSLAAGKLKLFAPMPPLSYIKGERLVNIGIKYTETGVDEIVGVSFKNDNIVFYGKDAPPTGELGGSCGIPNSGQGSTNQGLAGQVTLTVNQGNFPLWEMLIVRPSASSGANLEGSGVEVRDVKYKGKSVLKRGHAPILNVKYHPGGCGAFRDWQYAEGFFNAPDEGSQDPAPGIRILAFGQVATTAVESGSDTGNFQGVAIYQQDVGYGNEVVLVSEMNAGWYRYIMEWRFAEDGTIRPRYGFGSVQNGCVCAARNHHVYWRFDFDIVTSNNNVYKVERGRKFLTPITKEAKIFRSYQTNRSILIQNDNSDEAYQLTPNITDEEAYNYEGNTLQTFGAGDLWIMRFKGTAASPGELDDPTGPNFPAANLDPFINNESLGNNDVVVWYGAHQFRNDATSLTNFDRSGLVLGGVHTVGPDLRPVRW